MGLTLSIPLCGILDALISMPLVYIVLVAFYSLMWDFKYHTSKVLNGGRKKSFYSLMWD